MATASAGAAALEVALVDELELDEAELDELADSELLGEEVVDVAVEESVELGESGVDDALGDVDVLESLDDVLEDVAMLGSLVTGGVARMPRVIIHAAPNAARARTMTSTGANHGRFGRG